MAGWELRVWVKFFRLLQKKRDFFTGKNVWFINLVSIRKELFWKNPCRMSVPDEIKGKLSHQAYNVPLRMGGTVPIRGDIALHQFLAKYRRATMEYTILVEMLEDPAFCFIFVPKILLFLHKVLEGLGKATGKTDFIFHAAPPFPRCMNGAVPH